MRKGRTISTARIGIDVGGTFTDFVVISRSPGAAPAIRRHKTPSSPEDPSAAVAQGLSELVDAGLDLESVEAIVHGTTIGLNAIIQRSGARVSFVTSRGYRDLLGIARARLPESFDLHASAEVPLVPRERVIELDARLSSDGNLLHRPTAAELDALAADLRATAPEAVALSLVQGFTAPEVEHELAAEISSRLDGIPVVSAAGTWPEIREYERSLVAVLEAHIRPLMGRYYQRLRSRLHDLGMTAPLFISASNGGALTVDYAAEHPLETVLSGPASGVTAAASLLPEKNVLTIDMGGTSSDMSVVVGGSPVLTTRTMIGRLPLMLPVVDVNAVGAGGGSLITAGEQGDATALRIGPRSAGAVPGPVAYGLGGTAPTLTDAYLTAGILDTEAFLGGTIQLDRAAAQTALAGVARDAGLLTEPNEPDAAGAAAEYVLDMATVQMATSLRTLLAERGHEPTEFTLVPFGGAGPAHALLLAEELGIDEVIVPAAAATFCAYGAAVAPLRRDLARSIRRDLDAETADIAGRLVRELVDEGLGWLRRSTGSSEGARLRLAADMRYHGQAHELTVPLAEQGPELEEPLLPPLESMCEAFHREHERVHGFRDSRAAIELGTLRLAVLAPAAGASPSAAATGFGDRDGEAARRRRLRTGGAWRTAEVWDAADLAAGIRVRGPAVIDVSDSTVLVPAGWVGRGSTEGTLHLVKEDHA